MNLEVPVYVEELPGKPVPRYRVRPLFAQEPVEEHPSLDRALVVLARSLRRVLAQLGRSPRHDGLLDVLGPGVPTRETALELELHLRRATLRGRFLLVSFAALDRRVAFTPSLPELWFTVERGQRLEARAEEVLTARYRELERRDELPPGPRVGIHKRAWVTSVDVGVELSQKDAEDPAAGLMALLGAPKAANGAEELERVGRCLDWLYPDALGRAAVREREVEELHGLLADEPQPILLVGPPGVGKTTIVHEVVRRRIAARKAGERSRRGQVWLLSPARLISGMSYVGQWEQRVHAILRHAARRDHVLYFDDLLGLYLAGVTGSADLNVAHLVKSQAERGTVRLLGEATPEVFRRLQERDRGFADLFRVVRVDEPPAGDVLRILLRRAAALEAEHRCRFELDALPAALDLARAYLRETALPGTVANLLEQLATKHAGEEVRRAEVQAAFEQRTGLSASFQDERARLGRREVVDALGREVVGQPEALEALADVVLTAKSRLAERTRPLGSLLFLGPTGTGKTQAAKALARYLFSAPSRLVRLDMNELVGPDSVERLIGSFAEPDGLLTGAIRRQPFSVVLLDEIEKAHRSVLDLLLQVLGDGRLTDARGRTADFTNAIIIMTSNLGEREAAAQLGFGGDDGGRARSVYEDAAARFFRPELRNRLDRIVPFARLPRADVETIARVQLERVLGREGFLRRRCSLSIDARAMEQVVEAGYHPRLGARALKRAIEQRLVQPAAARLASLAPGEPCVLSILATPGGLAVRVQALPPRVERAVAAPVDLSPDAIEAAARRAEAPFSARQGLQVDVATLTAADRRAFALRDQAREVRVRLARLRDHLEQEAAARRSTRHLRAPSAQPRTGLLVNTRQAALRSWRELLAAEDVHAYLRELAAVATPRVRDAAGLFAEARAELGLLLAMADGRRPAGACTLVTFTGPAGGALKDRFAALYAAALGGVAGLSVERLEAIGDGPEGLAVHGAHAMRVLASEVGTHLVVDGKGELHPHAVRATDLPEGADARAALAEQAARGEAWLDALARGEAGLDDDPQPHGPIVRVYTVVDTLSLALIGGRAGDGPTVDLRSGLVTTGWPTEGELRELLLSAVDLGPAEVGA